MNEGNETMEKPSRYEVTDSRTGDVVGTFQSRNRATNFADKKDAAFGAVRYVVRPVWEA